MKNGTQARADRRVLISAALLGSGVGLALGSAYMAGGMSRAAVDHARAERVAQTADGAFSEAVLRREAGDPAMLALARAHDPQAADDAQDRQLQLLAARLRGEHGPDAVAQRQLKAARDLDCLTDAVYFEARGETSRGQQAVATVVLNRVKNHNFPKSVCGVVFQRAGGGCQFSFACDGSMRRRRDEDAWEDARRVAGRALSGYVLRDIGSATHFHTVDVSPDWGAQMLKVAQVGLHVFYRRNPHAPPPAAPDAPALPQPQRVEFTSGPAQPAPTLRIAAALVQKQPDPAPAAPAAAKPLPAKPAPPPAAKPPEAAPAGLTKTAAPEAPAAAQTAAS